MEEDEQNKVRQAIQAIKNKDWELAKTTVESGEVIVIIKLML